MHLFWPLGSYLVLRNGSNVSLLHMVGQGHLDVMAMFQSNKIIFYFQVINLNLQCPGNNPVRSLDLVFLPSTNVGSMSFTSPRLLFPPITSNTFKLKPEVSISRDGEDLLFLDYSDCILTPI